MINNNKVIELKKFAIDIRKTTIRQMETLGFGHIGPAMSIVEVLSVLYGEVMNINPSDPNWDERDRLVCSKGHAGPVIYSTLALKGYFPMEWLDTLNKLGTNLPSHCDMTKTPGIDMTTGSLGQGISPALGMALGQKLKGKDGYVYLIVGDGETQEGQIWEGASFAAHKKLDNVICFVDNNKIQVDNFTRFVNDMEDFEEKFTSFKWHAQRVDGHDVEAIYNAIEKAKAVKGKPSVIVLETQKGRGAAFCENFFNHHIPVSKEDAAVSIKVLDEELAKLSE